MNKLLFLHEGRVSTDKTVYHYLDEEYLIELRIREK